jgi:hypothetical protein
MCNCGQYWARVSILRPGLQEVSETCPYATD